MHRICEVDTGRIWTVVLDGDIVVIQCYNLRFTRTIEREELDRRIRDKEVTVL